MHASLYQRHPLDVQQPSGVVNAGQRGVHVMLTKLWNEYCEETAHQLKVLHVLVYDEQDGWHLPSIA